LFGKAVDMTTGKGKGKVWNTYLIFIT